MTRFVVGGEYVTKGQRTQMWPHLGFHDFSQYSPRESSITAASVVLQDKNRLDEHFENQRAETRRNRVVLERDG